MLTGEKQVRILGEILARSAPATWQTRNWTPEVNGALFRLRTMVILIVKVTMSMSMNMKMKMGWSVVVVEVKWKCERNRVPLL